MKKAISFVLGILGLVGMVFAHQPRLVFDHMPQPVIISHPEISQAFYGILSGNSDVYQIVAETGFHLYVQLLVPMMSEIMQDFTMTINNDQGNKWVFDGNQAEWTGFFEEYGGDWYLQGPAFEQEASSGFYMITIKSPGYTGRYSMVIGKKESFPFNEAINALISMPKLKTVFFEKSIFSSFANRIGLYLFSSLIILILLAYLLKIILRKIRS